MLSTHCVRSFWTLICRRRYGRSARRSARTSSSAEHAHKSRVPAVKPSIEALLQLTSSSGFRPDRCSPLPPRSFDIIYGYCIIYLVNCWSHYIIFFAHIILYVLLYINIIPITQGFQGPCVRRWPFSRDAGADTLLFTYKLCRIII